MDLHKIFNSLSEKLISDFQLTAEIWHGTGKGSAREAFLRSFLTDYLPQRYAVGAGAVNQAVKAIAISRGFLSPIGIEIACIPSFADIVIDGEYRTAIRFSVVPR